MKKATYETTKFDVRDGYYVEVSPNEKDNTYEFYLGKEDHTIKILMFGTIQTDCPSFMWEDMILSNVEDYINSCKEYDD